MGIQAVGPSFTGKAVTKDGNPYKKTNAWKIGLGTMVVAGHGLSLGVMKTDWYSKTLKAADIPKPSNTRLAMGFVIGLAVWLGIGALIDNSINKNRAKKADEKAAEEKITAPVATPNEPVAAISPDAVPATEKPAA